MPDPADQTPCYRPMYLVTLECVINGWFKKSSAPGRLMLIFVLLIVNGLPNLEQFGTGPFQTFAVVIVPDSISHTFPPKQLSVPIALTFTPWIQQLLPCDTVRVVAPRSKYKFPPAICTSVGSVDAESKSLTVAP